MSRAERLHGTLRPHERVHADVGWNVVPDIDFDRPFHEIAFATADELKRAGIIPANGQRITFVISHICGSHGVRAVDIELEQK
jgi:hypothetical protein